MFVKQNHFFQVCFGLLSITACKAQNESLRSAPSSTGAAINASPQAVDPAATHAANASAVSAATGATKAAIPTLANDRIVKSKPVNLCGHYVQFSIPKAAVVPEVAKVRVLFLNQSGCTATTTPAPSAPVSSCTFGWKYHPVWGFLRHDTIKSFFTAHQEWFANAGKGSSNGFSAWPSSQPAAGKVQPNEELSCVAQSIEVPYQDGQVITSQPLNPATYLIIVSLEDKGDRIKVRGTGSVTVVANGSQTVPIALSNHQTGVPVGTVNITVVGVNSSPSTTTGGAPAKLGFVPSSLTQNANVCGAITLNVVGANNVAAASTAAETATLTTSSAGGAFYSDAGCTAAVSAAQIAVGASSVAFYYKDSSVGTAILAATDASGLGLSPAAATATIGALSATQLVFAPSNLSQPTGVCGALSINLEDQNGNLTAAASTIAINLSATSTKSGAFYSDSSCLTRVASTQIAAGASAVGIYYKDAMVGTPGLNATDASGLGLRPAIETASITASAAATQLVFSPANLIQGVAACGALTVALQGPGNTPVAASAAVPVNLSTNSKSGTFSVNADCSSPLTSVQIQPGATSAAVFYSDSTAGSPTLSATDGAGLGLSPASETALISSNSLAFSGGSLTQDTSICGALTIQSVDMNNNAWSPASAVTIHLATSSSPTGAFYSDPGCQISITSTQQAANTSSSVVYYKDTAAGTPTLNATEASGLGWNGASETAQIAAANTLVFTNAPLSLVTGTCGTLTLQTQTATGSTGTVNTSVNFQLISSNASTGLFYSDQGCTQQMTTATIAAGTSSITFYYKDSTLGAAVLGAVESPAQGWMAASQTASIIPQ